MLTTEQCQTDAKVQQLIEPLVYSHLIVLALLGTTIGVPVAVPAAPLRPIG